MKGTIPDEVERLIGAAVRFLATVQRGAIWRDFTTLAGQSSEWVTAFTACAMRQAAPSHPAVAAAIRGLARRQRANGGWGYNARVPPDCDSTAWSLLCVQAGPWAKQSMKTNAANYIHRHLDRETGGFSTYVREDRVDVYIDADSWKAVGGWMDSHPCVTAVAVQALLISGEATVEQLRLTGSYLRSLRDDKCLWRAYWWPGHAYASFHAMRALSWIRAISSTESRSSAHALLNLQGGDGSWSLEPGTGGSVFETAFALLAILNVADAACIAGAHRAAAWICAQQQGDGSWPSAPILRIPTPSTRHPAERSFWRRNGMGTNVIVQDSSRVFTTASALWALAVYRSALPKLIHRALPASTLHDLSATKPMLV